ncbi:alpha-L-rhamnosidase A [Colletotrichum truncatum]|uniref:Alpha-L-rhamnosidase A n=1 Tax=Colletotrichum truncatum TaxID=5467 RepID=A0ACC3YHN2_COLTU
MTSLLTDILDSSITGQRNDLSPDLRSNLHSIDHEPSWYRYIRASKSKTIYPVRVLHDYTRGAVTNPLGLITGEGGPTVFTRLSDTDETPSVTIDFGLNTVGILSIAFAGSSTPGESESRPGIRLAFSETLQFLSNVSDFSRSYNGDAITPGSDQIAVKGDPYVWSAKHGCEHPDGKGKGKVCVDGLHGFRYLKIYLDALPSDAPYTTCLGEVKISSVNLQLSAFHGTPDTFKGWFECSDLELTRWWFDGVYTNDQCIDTFRAEDAEPRGAGSDTLEGKKVIHDAPKRDRDPYVGDLAVAALTAYLSHGELVAEASGNVLADLAAHQRSDGWIPPASINNYTLPLFDYPLWWVVCSHDYVWYTGDVGYLETYYPNLLAVLDKWYPSVTNPETQLVTKGLNGTGRYGDYAFLPRQGPVTYYNALYVLALRRAADMAEHLSRPEDAERWILRSHAVANALEHRNFDESVGAFYDGTRGATSEEFVDAHAQDGNSIAILADVVFGDTAKRILEYYSRTASRPYGNAFYDSDAVGQGFSQRVYAFVSYFELAAKFKTGDEELAESAVEEIKRLYGWMSGQDPGVTFWEGIGENGKPYEDGYTSMAHGWATGIVPLMSNYVLGVKPTSPGFQTFSVKPVRAGLTWAMGVVPTPRGGVIGVEWMNRGNGWFKIAVKAEAGLKGHVGVPVDGKGAVIEMDGRVVYDGRDGPGAWFCERRVMIEVDGKGWDSATVISVQGSDEDL